MFQSKASAEGVRVGMNRPDVQYAINDRRFYEEFDTVSSIRGPVHRVLIEANDPQGIVNLFVVELVL